MVFFCPRLARYLFVLAVVLSLSFGSLPGRCSSADNPTGLTIGTTESLVNLDPADTNSLSAWELLTHLYTGLTRQIPGTINYELALAASHTVSADGLTHTFTIRPDATFDDGTPITARTFSDSINRVLALNGRGGTAIRPYIKPVAAASDNTLIFTLLTPIPYLEALVALPPYFPVHPAIFTATAFNNTPKSLIANGIYKVDKFEVGRAITLVANPAWKGNKLFTPPIR